MKAVQRVPVSHPGNQQQTTVVWWEGFVEEVRSQPGMKSEVVLDGESGEDQGRI